jgi:uncharacterized paraquat-inducible protein A
LKILINLQEKTKMTKQKAHENQENIYCQKCRIQFGVSIPRKVGEPNYCSQCGSKLESMEEIIGD